MKENKTRGTRGIRFLIHLFTASLGMLIFWLLGFLIRDIESIQGPNYAQIEYTHVDQSIMKKREHLETQIVETERLITGKREEQRLAGDSSRNLQQTINQLLDLQKLSIEKAITLSEAEKETCPLA